jgi:hypothetical protein
MQTLCCGDATMLQEIHVGKFDKSKSLTSMNFLEPRHLEKFNSLLVGAPD